MAAIIRAISQMVTSGTPGQHKAQGQIPVQTVPQDSLGKSGLLPSPAIAALLMKTGHLPTTNPVETVR